MFRDRMSVLKVVGRALRAEPSTVSRLQLRVRVRDCDFNRHLNNARYLSFMDLGRWDWALRTGLGRRMLKEGLVILVAELAIRYRQELPYGVRFELETRLERIDGKALVVKQYFLVDGQARAEAELKILVLRGGKVVRPEGFEGYVAGPRG